MLRLVFCHAVNVLISTMKVFYSTQNKNRKKINIRKKDFTLPKILNQSFYSSINWLYSTKKSTKTNVFKKSIFISDADQFFGFKDVKLVLLQVLIN